MADCGWCWGEAFGDTLILSYFSLDSELFFLSDSEELELELEELLREWRELLELFDELYVSVLFNKWLSSEDSDSEFICCWLTLDGLAIIPK